MRISEAIEQLEAIKAVEGDIAVGAHDGGSPSDVCEVDRIEVVEGERAPLVNMLRVAVFIGAFR